MSGVNIWKTMRMMAMNLSVIVFPYVARTLFDVYGLVCESVVVLL